MNAKLRKHPLFIENTRIARAARFALDKHGKQKYGNKPYFYHLYKVAMVLHEYRDLFDPDHYERLLCAAWLHDVLEDCKVTYKELEVVFGPDVALLVWAVTNPSQPDDRYCKTKYRWLKGRLNDVRDAIPLKMADRIANMREAGKMRKYVEEFLVFKDAAYKPNNEWKPMWQELTMLFENQKDKLKRRDEAFYVLPPG